MHLLLALLVGMAGCFVGLVLFGVGVAVGYGKGRKSGEKWLEENGCYVCREKLDYPLGRDDFDHA